MERNNNLLRMLERIDYQAATLAAKTERLKLLKAQHELYLMRNWNVQHAILPSFETSMPTLQPVTEILPINFTQQQTFIPSQQVQQENISLLSSSIIPPAQQSIYYTPFKIPPQKCETNLKSDFVKYLSQINQFRDIYDKNGMSDSTYQSDLSIKGIAGPASFRHQLNNEYTCPTTSYPNAYYQDEIAAVDSRVYGNNKFIPPSHLSEKTNLEIYGHPEHTYQQQQQKTKAINNRTEFTDTIKLKLTNDEIIKTTQHHSISIAPCKNSTTSNDFVVNNSSNIQPDINNTAVSISNTSANATAINTNGVIKAVHQNKNENYVPPVRFQLNDTDAFHADNGKNLSGIADQNAFGYVNRMPHLDSSIRQISNENNRNKPLITDDARDGMEKLYEKSTQQQKKNYECNDVKPDIDKIEEVIYGEKINYPEIVDSSQPHQHYSTEEFNKRKHIILSSNVGQSSDVHGNADENEVFKSMQQLNISNAPVYDEKNVIANLPLNENLQNRQENKLVLSEQRTEYDTVNIISAETDSVQFQMNDDEANKLDPNNYESNNINSTSALDINNLKHTHEMNYESQSNDAIQYQQPQAQNIDHEIMSKVYQSQEVNYGVPVADTEDVSHAKSFEAMQQEYEQPQQDKQQQQQQSQGNYNHNFNYENQYGHEQQPYGSEQQDYETNESSEYNNQPEQPLDYNSEYYTTEQQQQYHQPGNLSYSADNSENVNYAGQVYQQGNIDEESTYQVPYYGSETDANANESNVYNNDGVQNLQYQDEISDEQDQQYQQSHLEQYTPVGQSEIYNDGQAYQQHLENVDPNYDPMYQYTPEPANYNNQEYPDESQSISQQHSNNAYYAAEPGENYYSDLSQMPGNILDQSSNNIENSYVESEMVTENTQPPTLTNVPIEHANDLRYENKYAPNWDTNGDEESSTTYSENVNIPQQILIGGGGGSGGAAADAVENMPVGVQGNIIGNVEERTNMPPNYLESESDASSAQQVKEMLNDESDFDFSTN